MAQCTGTYSAMAEALTPVLTVLSTRFTTDLSGLG